MDYTHKQKKTKSRGALLFSSNNMLSEVERETCKKLAQRLKNQKFKL